MGFSDKSSPYMTGVGNRALILNRIFWYLTVLSALSLAVFFLLRYNATLEKDSFTREVAIILLQIVAVGVVGAVFSLLLAQYTAELAGLQAKEQQAEQQRREAEKNERIQAERKRDAQRIVLENKNVLKKNIIKRLGQIYHEVKGARRMLRAKVLSLPYNDKNVAIANIYLKPYAQYMEVINDLQLDLESITEEVKPGITHVSLFSNSEKLYIGLKSMEDYLRGVFKEYETCRDKFNDKAYAPYIEFPQLMDLLSSAGEESRTGFRLEFINQYKTVMADMLRDLVSLDHARDSL